jgi:hypothetical protein
MAMGLTWNKALKAMETYVYRDGPGYYIASKLEDLLGVDFRRDYREEAVGKLWGEAEERLRGDERFERRMKSKSVVHWYTLPRAVVEYSEGGLEFVVEAYAVGEAEIFYMDGWEEKSFTYLLPKPLWFAERREYVPMVLLKLLSTGMLEGCGCRLTMLGRDVCEWRIGGEDVTLPRGFVDWLLELGEKPLEKLRELKLLDELTFKVAQRAWERLETGVSEGLEDGRLKLLKEHSGEVHRLSDWAGILGFKDKSGAYRYLKRMEDEGLVKVEKTGDGLKVETAG